MLDEKYGDGFDKELDVGVVDACLRQGSQPLQDPKHLLWNPSEIPRYLMLQFPSYRPPNFFTYSSPPPPPTPPE